MVEVPNLPSPLIEAMKGRRGVLFLGAGASLEARDKDGNRPPDGDSLGDLVAKKFFGKEMPNRRLAGVSEMAIASSGGTSLVYEYIRQTLQPFAPARAHRLVSEFQWRLIATTNYDLLVEQAYDDNKALAVQDLVPFVKDAEPIEERMQKFSEPVQYVKLHGCLDHKVLHTGYPGTANAIRALGATPVSVRSHEVYAGLERGNADAAEVSLEMATELSNVAPPSGAPVRPAVRIVAASSKFWHGLSEREKFELGGIVADAGEAALKVAFDRERNAKMFFAERGMALPTAWEAGGEEARSIAAEDFLKSHPGVQRDVVNVAALTVGARPTGRLRMVTTSQVPMVAWSNANATCPSNGSPREVYFISNRNKENDADGRFVLGSERAERLYFGSATFEFDHARPIGNESRRYFRWRNVTFASGKDSFLQRVRTVAESCSSGQVLLFVHGYNNSFEDAVRRIASIAEDIKFKGPAITFTWPTEGVESAYWRDLDDVLYSVPLAKEALKMLADADEVGSIEVISHSMGSRVIVYALRELALGAGLAKLKNSIFGAPEIDRGLFLQNADLIKRLSGRVTLYASQNDGALSWASNFNDGVARAGGIGSDGILLVEGIDSIDASLVDTSFFSARHAYIADKASVLSDVHAIVTSGNNPSERFGLAESNTNPMYWWFRRR
ncbi:MAG: alpha/beta hydrolase [Alphaproteobacteria bacterium]|nr:alpha/beta hydrolase [Alphaproteobacteria bacterium]